MPFTVSRAVIDDAERGAERLDFDELEAAVRTLGEAENMVVFHGHRPPASSGSPRVVPRPRPAAVAVETYPTTVATAVRPCALRRRRPVRPGHRAERPHRHHRDAPSTAAAAARPPPPDPRRAGRVGARRRGAVVLSVRGGDFVLDCGEDLSIGYLAHDAEAVQLYLEESISFHVVEPDAAVVLR